MKKDFQVVDERFVFHRIYALKQMTVFLIKMETWIMRMQSRYQ